MSWIIISLSILSAVLLPALLVAVEGLKLQLVRVPPTPRSAGTNGRAGRPTHMGRHQQIRRVFSMF
ncbi:MAG: hypothetical protein FJ245_07680 [Nitrospira sp.]|nr:hypothetical protein [Nitrospira sp.]